MTQPGMIEVTKRDCSFQFYQYAIQYYIAARSAVDLGLSPVSANLFHHAVEMFLKGQLSKTIPLKQIKKQFCHDLVATWQAFKAIFPGEDLSAFDTVVAELHQFEDIRYPDEIIRNGAVILMGWNPVPKNPVTLESGYVMPHYQLAANDIDRLVGRLLPLCRINPIAYMGGLGSKEKRILAYENPACKGWFTSA